MILSIDFETFSPVDIKKAGAYRYAEAAGVWCLSVKADNQPPVIWCPPHYWLDSDPSQIYRYDLQRLINDADEIHAFNIQFERAIWAACMVPMGFDPIPLEKWRCTAARARAAGLPPTLDGACKAVGLPIEKDMAGRRLMLKWAKPNKRTGKYPEDPEEFARLCEYCRQDTEVESALGKVLRHLTEPELELLRLDQRINDRGIYIDQPSIENLTYKVKEHERRLLVEVADLSGGRLSSVRQVSATLEVLKGWGVELPDLKKKTVEKAIKELEKGVHV